MLWCDGNCTTVTGPVKRDAEVEHTHRYTLCVQYFSSYRQGDNVKLCGSKY